MVKKISQLFNDFDVEQLSSVASASGFTAITGLFFSGKNKQIHGQLVY
jgi:hypothetical protein